VPFDQLIREMVEADVALLAGRCHA
jgi:hypothetical protein